MLNDHDILQPAYKQAAICILDTLGCAIAGRFTSEAVILKDLPLLCGNSESNGVHIWGYGGMQAGLAQAVMVNAAAAHALDFDDLDRLSKTHPGAVVVPAALAVGEFYALSGFEVLRAVIIGYEAMIRIGKALGTNSHRKRGFHATSTCGPFGAAAAAAVLKNFDETKLQSSISLASTMTGGLQAFLNGSPTTKRLHAGLASWRGILSAFLTIQGVSAPPDGLGATDGGFLRAFSDSPLEDELYKNLRDPLAINNISIKAYPCCGILHPAIEAALKVRQNYKDTMDKIDRVVLRTFRVSDGPWGHNGIPETPEEAKFCTAYAVAVALYDGKATMEQFSQKRVADPKLHELVKCITIEFSEEYQALYPQQWNSDLELYTTDGKKFFAKSGPIKGDPDNPLSEEESIEKFESLAGSVLGKSNSQKIAKEILRLEDCSNVKEIIEKL